MMNIDALREKISGVVRAHALGGGAYARWLWQDAAGKRELGANEYGVADAANILYTIGEFPSGREREEMLGALASMQDPESGLFTEATHHPIHTTAHCTAALELSLMAEGAGELYFEIRLSPWDHAAALTILKEAGGCYTGIGGDVSFEGPSPVLAANSDENLKLLSDVVDDVFDGRVPYRRGPEGDRRSGTRGRPAAPRSRRPRGRPSANGRRGTASNTR